MGHRCRGSLNVYHLMNKKGSDWKAGAKKVSLLSFQQIPFLTCPGGGLFMVLRARWILGGPGEADGGEEAVTEEEDGAGGRLDLLLEGPETLIFARPGDNEEDVEGEEDDDDEDADERDLTA